MVHKTAHKVRYTTTLAGIYYFRMRIPRSSKVIKFSLRTRDPAQAAVAAATYAQKIKDAYRKMHSKTTGWVQIGPLKFERDNIEEESVLMREAIKTLIEAGLDPVQCLGRPVHPSALPDNYTRPPCNLNEQFEAYINHRTTIQKDLKPSSEREVRLSFKLYKKYVNTNNLHDITQRMHTDFADFAKAQHANASKIKNKANLKPVSNSTANKHISNINGFFKYLKRKHLADLEPIPLFKKRPETIVKPFPPELIDRIFEEVILKSKTDDAVIFTLCLCTGARVGEIAQLKVQDIVLKNGIYVINITDDSNKTVKNEQSKRYITAPSFLNGWFSKILARRERTGKSRLFLTIKQDAAGTYSGTISKRFAYKFNKISDDKSYKLHSFRHTFITKASTFAEFSAEHIKKITGHKTGEIHHDVYQHQDLATTHKIIETTAHALITQEQINKLITKIKA